MGVGGMIEEVYVSVCSVCGHPLTQEMLAGETRKTDLINYVDRCIGSITLVFCAECLEKIDQYSNGGVAEAVKRLKQDREMD